MKGKVCLITGGSRGGMLKGIAREYLNHGAKAVILMSRNKEKNEEVARDLGERCFSEPGDVTKIDSCKQVVKNVIEKHGQIDVLINGAAGNFLASAEKISSNGVRKVLEIDTLGTFNMSQTVFKASMKERR